jgi:phosphoribosylaminoimidazole carboxylase (NCAIR synthetase)
VDEIRIISETMRLEVDVIQKKIKGIIIGIKIMMIIEEMVEFKIEMKNMMVKDLQGKIKIIEDLQNKTIHGILKANINHKIIIQVVVEAGEEK